MCGREEGTAPKILHKAKRLLPNSRGQEGASNNPWPRLTLGKPQTCPFLICEMGPGEWVPIHQAVFFFFFFFIRLF